MKRTSAFVATVGLLGLLASPAIAEEKKATFTFTSLELDAALDLAKAALKKCQEDGFQVAVSVVDRGGHLQVALRDRFAGAHTPDTSYRKAWTALSFRTDTLELGEFTESGEAWAVRTVKKALPLGGGVQVRHGDGNLLGAVGVSGTPSGKNDDQCAKAGIAAIADRIAF